MSIHYNEHNSVIFAPKSFKFCVVVDIEVTIGMGLEGVKKEFQIFKSTNFLDCVYHTDYRNAHSWSDLLNLDKHRAVTFGRGFPPESIFLVS